MSMTAFSHHPQLSTRLVERAMLERCCSLTGHNGAQRRWESTQAAEYHSLHVCVWMSLYMGLWLTRYMSFRRCSDVTLATYWRRRGWGESHETTSEIPSSPCFPLPFRCIVGSSIFSSNLVLRTSLNSWKGAPLGLTMVEEIYLVSLYLYGYAIVLIGD